MRRIRGAAVVFVVAVGLVSMTSTAKAEYDDGDGQGMDVVVWYMFAYGFTGLADIATIGGMSAQLVEPSELKPFWAAGSYITGGVSVVLGGLAFHIWGSDKGSIANAMAPPMIIVGAVNIVLASVGLAIPGKTEAQAVSVAPLVAPDGQGGYYSGIGINVVGW